MHPAAQAFNPPIDLTAYVNFAQQVGPILAARRQEANARLDNLKTQVADVKNTMDAIRETEQRVHVDLSRQVVQVNANRDALVKLVQGVTELHREVNKVEDRANRFEDAEIRFNATVAQVVALAMTTGLAVAGVAILPASPFVGQALLGGVPAGVAAAKAPVQGPQVFQFQQFFKQLCQNMSANLALSLVSVPVVRALGAHFVAKTMTQGWLNALGTLIQKKANGDPVKMEQLMAAFAAGCGGALASAGIDKLTASLRDEILQIAVAAASSAANAGTNRVIINAIEKKPLEDGLWEVMLISAPIGAAVKFANIQRYKSRLKEFDAKRGALEKKLAERDKAVADGQTDLEALDNAIAQLQNDIYALAAEVAVLEQNWAQAKVKMREWFDDLWKREYRPNCDNCNRAMIDTPDSIFERIWGGEVIQLKKRNHFAYLEREGKQLVEYGINHHRKFYEKEIAVYDQNLISPENIQANLQQMNGDLDNKQVERAGAQYRVDQLNKEVGEIKGEIPVEEAMLHQPVILVRLGTSNERAEQAAARKAAEESLRKLQALPMPALMSPLEPLKPPPAPIPFVRPIAHPFVFPPPAPPQPQPVTPPPQPVPLPPQPAPVPPLPLHRDVITARIEQLRTEIMRDSRDLHRAEKEIQLLKNTGARHQAKKTYLTNLIHELNLSMRANEKKMRAWQRRLAALNG